MHELKYFTASEYLKTCRTFSLFHNCLSYVFINVKFSLLKQHKAHSCSWNKDLRERVAKIGYKEEGSMKMELVEDLSQSKAVELLGSSS